VSLPAKLIDEESGIPEPLTVKLTDKDRMLLQVYAGSLKAQVMKEFIESEAYKSMSGKAKTKAFTEMNRGINRAVQGYMKSSIMQGIEDGTVILDKKAKTYTYTTDKMLPPLEGTYDEKTMKDNPYVPDLEGNKKK
jgi:hypothetical protein